MVAEDAFQQERLYHAAYLAGKAAVYDTIATNKPAKYLAALLNQSFIWKEEQLSFVDEQGCSPLMKALALGMEEHFKVLVDSAPDNLKEILNQPDNTGNTALSVASKWGLSDAVELMIPMVSDVNLQDASGFTAAHNACSLEEPPFTVDNSTRVTGQSKILELLGAKNANFNLQTNAAEQSMTVLHTLLRNGFGEKAKYLIEKKADVNAVDESGRSPLHYAVLMKDIECIKLLITNGANLEQKDTLFGMTPFLAAAAAGCSVEALDLLKGPEESPKLAMYTGPEEEAPQPLRFICARNGKNAMHFAAKEGSIELIQFLNRLAPEKYPTMADKLGRLPLHDAAQNWQVEACKELVSSCNAYIDDQDDKGHMALHSACIGWEEDNFWPPFTAGEGVRDWLDAEAVEAKPKHVATVKTLLELGADPNGVDDDGNVALHFAARSGVIEAIDLFKGSVDLEVKNKENQTPGHWAAANGHSLTRTGLYIAPRKKELPVVVQALAAVEEAKPQRGRRGK